jgi:hypothetical protein
MTTGLVSVAALGGVLTTLLLGGDPSWGVQNPSGPERHNRTYSERNIESGKTDPGQYRAPEDTNPVLYRFRWGEQDI